MIIVNGVMEYCMQNTGSKSEGKMALLKCDDGKEYFLYRSGEHPVNDVFFIHLLVLLLIYYNFQYNMDIRIFLIL